MAKVSAKAIMDAAAPCNLEEIQRLIAAGASEKHMVTAKQNAVTEAAFGYFGGMDKPEAIRLKVIEELVEAGCPVEGHALCRPIDQEELEIMKYLIAHGADVNAEAPHEYYFAVPKGVCPMYVAIYFQRYAPLKMLVEAGANVNQMTGPIIRFGTSARCPLIYWAANKNFADAIPLMKKAGADLEALSWHGQTALFIAVLGNNYHATDALIAAGADVNHATTQGIMPLTIARENKNADIEYLLVKAGAREA